MTPARSLDSLFSPASVAVVGASDDSRKWGNWLARGALRGESRRPAYLVNRRGGQVLGRTAYRSLADLPQAPELVVLAIPVEALSEAVDDALAAGARAIVAISAGASDSPATAALDAALAARVRAAGAVLLGPNCLGVLDRGEQLDLASSPLPAGEIGLISQSGNLALELGQLAQEEGLGFSRFASLGNQADLGVTELLLGLAEHPATRLIAVYVEDFLDGRGFARAAREVTAAGKPVVVLAIERGKATTRAARSHTGALASDGAAIDAACRAAGAHRVHTPRELIDVAQALLRAARPRGRRVAVLSDGGGHGAVAAALAASAGLELPALAPETEAALRALLPPSAGVSNPIDLAGAAERDARAFDRTAAIVLGSGEVDALVVTGYFGGYAEYGPQLAASELEAARALGEVAVSRERPVIAHTMYPQAPAARALREAGVPTYASIDQAVATVARLAGGSGALPAAIPELPAAAPPVSADGYEAARSLLAEAGVLFVAQRTVAGAEDACRAAGEVGYPVVLKALGRLHKSDGGGVVLGLQDAAAVRAAYADLERRLAPPACSVEHMAALDGGVELLIGARWDPRFGPVALAGSGGVYAEILRDTAVALAPLDEAGAEALLRSLRAAPLLLGARGRPPLALAAAARALSALAGVAAAHPELAEIEINPLLVTRSEAIALDARFVRTTPSTQKERPWTSPTPPSTSRFANAPAG
jgi:acetate---CoA ligase (ADP-forming)